jgi:hypothetical protein
MIVLYYGSMKKLILTLTVSSFSFLPFNSAKAYQDLNVTLDGVSYNLISPTNNWWVPGGETELADLNTPGFNLAEDLAGNAGQVRGGTRGENQPVPALGTSGTYLQIAGSGAEAFTAIVYATNGDRYALRYNRADPSSALLDGLSLASLRKRPNGSTSTWQDIATNGPGMVFPSTLNVREHIANENVKNFFEYGLSTGYTSVNVFSSAPTYYSDPSEVGGPSGGAFVEQAEELNIGLTFQDGQWAPAQ